MSGIRKALSVRSPWWWYIVHGYKDVENRDWRTSYRGPVWIHASKWWNGSNVLYEIEDIHGYLMEPRIARPPRLSDLHPFRGCIVGSAEIVDCVDRHNSRWFMGEHGFVLRNAVPLEVPIPFKGSLGLFDVPDGLISEAA